MKQKIDEQKTEKVLNFLIGKGAVKQFLQPASDTIN